MYRSRVVVAGAFVLASVPAIAADLIPAPPPEPIAAYQPAWNWSGFYAGVHGGYTTFNNDATVNSGAFAGSSASADPDGFIGGFQIGYDHQVGSAVIGAELDLGWVDASQGKTMSGGAGGFSADTNWVSTLTARVGHEISPGTLAYAKGGIAWQDVDYTRTSGGAVSTTNETRDGWLLGGGVEHMLTQDWSVDAEYNYIDYGKDSSSFSNSAPVGIDSDQHLFKVGLNYRFPVMGY